MKVYGYLRVSTDEQAESGQSLETQKAAIESYAERNGHSVDGFYIDAGVSGSVPVSARPEGQRLVSDLKAGDWIIVAKMDRMFRSTLNALQVTETFKKKKVALHVISPFNGNVIGEGFAKAQFINMASYSELERYMIGERTREVMRRRSANGLYNGGHPRFGYDLGEDGRLTPNEEQQAILARMVALRADGQSYGKISAAVGIGRGSCIRILARQA